MKHFSVFHTRFVLGWSMIPLVFLAVSCSRQEQQPIFEDVTLGSGLADFRGMTYGAFWGDPNQDGLPDVYLTNHLHTPALLQNIGDGEFLNVTDAWFRMGLPTRDKHGAHWADFDNDGLLDLVQLSGAGRGVGQEPKHLYQNRGDHFFDVAPAVGTDNPFGRTRMPLWIDLNRDGYLDLLQGEESRHDGKVPPRVFLRTGEAFTPADDSLPLVQGSVPFCVLTDLVGDALPELICRVADKNVQKTAQVFDLAAAPPRELDLLPVTAFEDLVAGDFDNDGRIDLYLARKNPGGIVALGQPAINEVIADVSIYRYSAGREAGFRFSNTGFLEVEVVPEYPKGVLAPEEIAIGANKVHPKKLTFQLSAETSGVQGLPPYQPASGTGVQIGESAPGVWEVRVSAPEEALRSRKMRFQDIQFRIRSSSPITELTTIGESGNDEHAPGRLFMNRPEGMVKEGDKRGIHDSDASAVNAVAADFDNDMDLDLFILRSGDAGNHPNLYLQNDGNGYFEPIEEAAGAAGPLAGVGDSVTTADFDGDGAMDLLIANGGSMGRQLGIPSAAGGYRLYRNRGNDNHWLEVDLQGTQSNRDGIGARVEVTTAGVTQVRIQDGGIHNKAQNHSRLHFGLANNAKIDKITVSWPSGVSQTLMNVSADQILKITEE